MIDECAEVEFKGVLLSWDFIKTAIFNCYWEERIEGMVF